MSDSNKELKRLDVDVEKFVDGSVGGRTTDADPQKRRSFQDEDTEHDPTSTPRETHNTLEEPRSTISNTPSSIHELVVIPRDKRRGLLARFALIPEVENPKDYSRRTKWTLTAFVALAGAAGPMASGIFMRT